MGTCDFKGDENGFEALLDMANASAAYGARNPAAGRCNSVMHLRQRTHAGS